MYTVLQMYRQFGLFLLYNAYVPEGENERGKGTTPTSISKFDSFDIKTFGHDNFTGFKMPTLLNWHVLFSAILLDEIEGL